MWWRLRSPKTVRPAHGGGSGPGLKDEAGARTRVQPELSLGAARSAGFPPETRQGASGRMEVGSSISATRREWQHSGAGGPRWPTAGLLFAITLFWLSTYSLTVLLTPVAWMMTPFGRLSRCCSRRQVDALPPEVAAAIAPDRPAPSTMRWTGPGTGSEPSTEYYRRGIKGRGAGRRPNHVVIRRDGQVARLQATEGAQRRIDRHGFTFAYSEVLGCTSRAWRRELDGQSEVHLCRKASCGFDHGCHVLEYAALDAGAIVDLQSYAHPTPLRFLMLFFGWWWRCLLWL